jgi:hypothetical protein
MRTYTCSHSIANYLEHTNAYNACPDTCPHTLTKRGAIIIAYSKSYKSTYHFGSNTRDWHSYYNAHTESYPFTNNPSTKL